MPEEFLQKLSDIVNGRVLSGSSAADYYRDESPTSFSPENVPVVFPESTEEVAALLRLCSSHSVPVFPRGAGTGLAGGAVPLRQGVVLCCSRMNRILSWDEDNFSVTLQPGVLLKTLQEECERRGLFYPPDPGEKEATLGGNMATNAGGMRALKYGTSRDYLRAARVVTADGEVADLGADVAKNSCGYDMVRLMAGSEGTLGIFTSLTLRLLPLPKETVSLLVPFAERSAALKAVPEILRRVSLPRALEYMEAAAVAAVRRRNGNSLLPDIGPAGACLLLSWDGDNPDALCETAEEAGMALASLGAEDAYLLDTPVQQRRVFEDRSGMLDALRAAHRVAAESDAAVPLSHLAEFAESARRLCAERGVALHCFGHAGDGNLHCYLCDCDDTTAWELLEPLARLALDCGGVPTGEHGIGALLNGFSKLELPGSRLWKSIKQALDPGNILNPGKVL